MSLTQDEIIRMALEAERQAYTFCESIGDTGHNHWFDAYNERFAALVAAHEREACAKLVIDDAWALTFQTFRQYRIGLIEAIRARSEK